MTAPIVKVMVANKLPATVLAQIFLLVIAGFAVSLYILPTATGTANGILSFHTSNIPCLRCFLFARRLSAYILGHHPLVNAVHLKRRGKSGDGLHHPVGNISIETVITGKDRNTARAKEIPATEIRTCS